MATKKLDRVPAGNVERTTVKGRTVWRVHSAKSGEVLSLATKSSSKRSMERTSDRFGQALKSLADR